MLIKIGNGENERTIAVTVVKSSENKDLYQYYIGETKIGVLEVDVMEDNILMLQNTLENELSNQIKDAIDRLPREEIEEEGKLSKAIDTYQREFGNRDERVRQISWVNLDDRSSEDRNRRKKKRDDERNKKRKQVERVRLQNGQRDLTSTEDDVNIKQYIDLDERANDMHDVRKWLGLPQDIEAIGVIESYEMSELEDKNGDNYDNKSTRYSLIAIGKDGKVRPLSVYLPGLEQRDSTGNDPRRETYQVDNEGRVEKDAVLSEYQIGSKIIQIDNRELGRIEINIGEEARDSTQAMAIQLRTDNVTFATDTSTRSVIGEYEEEGEDTVELNLEEAQKHPDPSKDKMDERDVDGDLSTVSHIHIGNEIVLESGEKISFSELAKRYGFYNDGVPDSEHAREVYAKERIKSPEKTPDEILEELDYEYEDPRLQDGRDM